MTAIGVRSAEQQWRDVGAPPSPVIPPANFVEPQHPVLKSINSSITNVVLNGSGKIESYQRGGVAHTVTYPDANTVVITSAQGFSKTITLDGSGKVVSIL